MHTNTNRDHLGWIRLGARQAASWFCCVVCALVVMTVLLPLTASADFLLNGDIRYAMDGPVQFIDPADLDLLNSRNDGDTVFATGANVGGDLLIGDVGTGGMIGSNALPLITFDLSTGDATNLKPIRSDNAVIGNQVGSEGTAALSGFMFLPLNDPATGNPVAGHTEPFGGNWRVRNDLAIGNNGNGTLSIDNRARVEVGGVTTVGGTITTPGLFDTTVPNTGSGNVTINGVNSRLVTTNETGTGAIALVVGVDTQGIIDVSGGGVLETRNSAGFPDGDGTTPYPGPPTAQARTAVVGMLTGGDGLVRLSDSGTLWDIDGDLVIANGLGGATSAQGSVEIIDDALLQVRGSITTNTSGNLVMRGGTARLFSAIGSSTPGTITNNGAIIGDGLIDSNLTITPTGVVRNQSVEIDNAGTVTTLRELLTVSGTVTNAGLIESTGGEMIFQGPVANGAGVVFARDATIQFQGGVTGGQLVLLGETTLIGQIANPGTMIVNQPGDTAPPFFNVGSVTWDPTPAGVSAGEIAAGMGVGPVMSLGLTGTSPLRIDGDLSLNGTPTLDFEYIGEDTIDLGSIITAISVTGDITGTFANDSLIADGFEWDIDILGDDVLLTAASVFTGTEGDFDLDGDVDGTDFLTWQQGSASPSELTQWQAGYGGGSGSGAVASTVVPEPSTLALVLLTLVCYPQRSRG